MAGAQPPTHGPGNPLAFSLSFLEGKGLLGLRARTFFDLVALDRLELEIPRLRFPFDVTGGATRFQHKRCLLRSAVLAIDDARAESWLRSRPRLHELGVAELIVRFADGMILVAGRVQAGERSAEFTARALVAPAGGRRIAVSITDVRFFGWVALAAPQLGLGLLSALGAPAEELAIEGATDVSCDPLHMLLMRTLPTHGWRLPDLGPARVATIKVGPARLVIGYGAPGSEAEDGAADERLRARFAVHEEGKAAYRQIEAQLAAGDLAGARAAYRRQLERGADHPFVLQRLLEIGCAAESWLSETETLAHELLRARPELAPAVAALALVADARGDAREAGLEFERLAELYTALGDKEDALRAQLAAARAWAQVEPTRATPLLERALATRPRASEVAEALAERLLIEGRVRELGDLLRRRITLTETPGEQAALALRLGQLCLSQGEAEAAVAELERAVRLDESGAQGWEALARALDAAGQPVRAVKAADQAARLHGERGHTAAAARAHLSAAAMWQRAGDDENALLRLQRALAIAPADPAVHEQMGRLLERRGRPDEAARAYACQAELCEGAPRARALAEQARLEWRALGDPAGARARLQEALALAEDAGALALLAELDEH
ncbi:MAG TPA: hypothetical protein VKN99_13750, partial [Polyangia bacterium]|nr:hypothetical protein [Polyangia bacterium]